jgi:hypothetical protein
MSAPTTAKGRKRPKFPNGVEKCVFEWYQEPKRKFRPLMHVCGLEFEHKGRHVCICGVGKLRERQQPKRERRP